MSEKSRFPKKECKISQNCLRSRRWCTDQTSTSTKIWLKSEIFSILVRFSKCSLFQIILISKIMFCMVLKIYFPLLFFYSNEKHVKYFYCSDILSSKENTFSPILSHIYEIIFRKIIEGSFIDTFAASCYILFLWVLHLISDQTGKASVI